MDNNLFEMQLDFEVSEVDLAGTIQAFSHGHGPDPDNCWGGGGGGGCCGIIIIVPVPRP